MNRDKKGEVVRIKIKKNEYEASECGPHAQMQFKDRMEYTKDKSIRLCLLIMFWQAREKLIDLCRCG